MSKNKKDKKRKRHYFIVAADRTPYTMQDWETEVDSDINSYGVKETFIDAVAQMKLEKVKFIMNSDFMNFNKECPSYMQDNENGYCYGSIYDKAIYECLSNYIYTDYGGYMEVANLLMKCRKVNYDLLYATLICLLQWNENRFKKIITKISKNNSKAFLELDRYFCTVYDDYEDISDFISKFTENILNNEISINYFPNLFVYACWSDNKELIEFFISNNFNYHVDFDRNTMDEILVKSTLNYCDSILQVAYKLSKLEDSKEALLILENLMQ